MNRGRGERTSKRLDDLTRHEGKALQTQDQTPQAVLAVADQRARRTSRPHGQHEEESQAGSQCSLPVRKTSDGDSTCGLPPVLTVREVCKLMKLSRNTVYQELRTGGIPGLIQVGRAVRVSGPILARWLQDGTCAPRKRRRVR